MLTLTRKTGRRFVVYLLFFCLAPRRGDKSLFRVEMLGKWSQGGPVDDGLYVISEVLGSIINNKELRMGQQVSNVCRPGRTQASNNEMMQINHMRSFVSTEDDKGRCR